MEPSHRRRPSVPASRVPRRRSPPLRSPAASGRSTPGPPPAHRRARGLRAGRGRAERGACKCDNARARTVPEAVRAPYDRPSEETMDRPKVYGNFINGAWAEGSGDYANTNPSDTRDVIGRYARATQKQALDAIAAAQAAFPAWSVSTPQQRFDALDAIGSEILNRKAELGDLLAREEGKTLPEAIGEVVRAAYIFKFFAGEALRIPGEIVQSVRPGVGVEMTREPLGVVSIITPWNFPIAIPAWKIAPALCYGNAVVFKPAELVPGSAWALTEIISRAGLPAGVFNLVMGSGREVGQAIVDHAGIDAVSFTGSQQVGKQVAASCVARGAKVQLEMGGKNPQVVLDDANLNVAVEL